MTMKKKPTFKTVRCLCLAAMVISVVSTIPALGRDSAGDLKPKSTSASLFMGEEYWSSKATIILGKLTHVESVDGAYIFQIDVLAEEHGNLKLGDHISVRYSVTGVAYEVLEVPTGAIALFSTLPTDKPKVYRGVSNLTCPIGWTSDRQVREEDVKPIESAMEVLRTVIPKKETDDLDHKKALELFQSNEYGKFAIGASMLASEGTKADAELLLKVLDGKPEKFTEVSQAQASWAAHLLWDVVPDATKPDPSVVNEKLQAFIRSHDPYTGNSWQQKARDQFFAERDAEDKAKRH